MLITPAHIQFIKENASTMTVMQMAKKLYISYASTLRICHELGVQWNRRNKPARPVDDDIIKPDRQDFAWAYPDLRDYGITGRINVPSLPNNPKEDEVPPDNVECL